MHHDVFSLLPANSVEKECFGNEEIQDQASRNDTGCSCPSRCWCCSMYEKFMMF